MHPIPSFTVTLSPLSAIMFHNLKTWPDPFREIMKGNKRFELRKNDRGFEVGDIVVLQEWDPKDERYTERFVLVEIDYITQGQFPGLLDGYCVFNFNPLFAHGPHNGEENV